MALMFGPIRGNRMAATAILMPKYRKMPGTLVPPCSTCAVVRSCPYGRRLLMARMRWAAVCLYQYTANRLMRIFSAMPAT